MPRRKSRRLWLQVKFNNVGSASRYDVLTTLLRSIEAGDYVYSRGWRVALGWSNKENGELKWGEWTKEMRRSAQSSEGFDFAVADYLESQRRQL